MRLMEWNNPSRRFIESDHIYLEKRVLAPGVHDYSGSMLRLVTRMEAELDDNRIWYASTSHEILNLSSTLDRLSSSYIQVIPTRPNAADKAKFDLLPPEERGGFVISYTIPAAASLWPESRMEMRAISVTECLAAIAVSLRECG